LSEVKVDLPWICQLFLCPTDTNHCLVKHFKVEVDLPAFPPQTDTSILQFEKQGKKDRIAQE